MALVRPRLASASAAQPRLTRAPAIRSNRPMPDRPHRLVLDTNVCLDVFVFADPLCGPLHDALHRGDAVAFTREDCRAEWLAVQAYPQLALSPARRAQAAADFDAWVRTLPADVAPVPASALPRCGDPDDQKFLELAL